VQKAPHAHQHQCLQAFTDFVLYIIFCIIFNFQLIYFFYYYYYYSTEYIQPTTSAALAAAAGHANVVGLTGTGIAPFRSFWRRIFYDGIPGQPSQPFSDNAMFWLLSGFANTDRSVQHVCGVICIVGGCSCAMRLVVAAVLGSGACPQSQCVCCMHHVLDIAPVCTSPQATECRDMLYRVLLRFLCMLCRPAVLIPPPPPRQPVWW
jgi:hypothetical protein